MDTLNASFTCGCNRYPTIITFMIKLITFKLITAPKIPSEPRNTRSIHTPLFSFHKPHPKTRENTAEIIAVAIAFRIIEFICSRILITTVSSSGVMEGGDGTGVPNSKRPDRSPSRIPNKERRNPIKNNIDRIVTPNGLFPALSSVSRALSRMISPSS